MKIFHNQKIPGIFKSMTQETIDKWAHLSGDYNPIHVDPDYAKTTKFGSTIAHGHIALSYIGEMMLSWVGKEWAYSGKLTEIKFVSPVYTGKRYHIGGWVSSVEHTDYDNKIVTCEIYVKEAEVGRDCVIGSATFTSKPVFAQSEVNA